MIDTLFFIYCTILAFSGFVLAFYAILAQSRIDLEAENGLKKGISFDTQEGTAYFARRFDQWNVGSLFKSEVAPIVGIIIALIGSGINLIHNSWWTSILTLGGGYILYLVVSDILKSKVQIVSILSLLLSIFMILK